MASLEEAQQIPVKWYHDRNKVVTQQKYQSAHEPRVKRNRDRIERSKGPHPSNTQPKEETRCEEWKPNDSPTPQKVKQVAEHKAIPDKPTGNSKCVNTRQAMDSYWSGARTRPRYHQLVPSQYMGGGSWVRGKIGCGLAVGKRGKPIPGFSLKLFWGKCPAGMTYHLKEAKMSWNHYMHTIRVSKREYSALIQMRMPWKTRK